MNIALLGFGAEGQAALKYWQKPDNQITICDQNQALVLPEGVDGQLGPDYLKGLDRFDLIVRSPGLKPSDIDATVLAKVTTVTNEFYKVCPTKNIIGVTGTKGKGTTSTLIYEILKAAGQTVHLGGNIGVPALSLLEAGIQANDWVVLEQSSFQLSDQKHSPHIAVCLMVVPEHLNWHTDMDDYLHAKQNLFAHQTETDIVVFNRNNAQSQQVVSVSPAASRISYEVPGPGAEPKQTTGAYLKGDTIYMDDVAVCQASDIALLGRHNIENVCAAIAATWQIIGQNPSIIQQVVRNFKGLEHRLELVRTIGSTNFYNDSFAATPEAAGAAIEAISGNKVLILGGFDRQLDLSGLAQSVSAHQTELTKVLLIGESAQRLSEALSKAGFENYSVSKAETMKDIVTQAFEAMPANGSVILTPGFASFDMFKNFEDRGNQFKQAVLAL
ncbi:MAG: UDP-N-acetylmuramoylalanine--D-glutamate ligase [Patescibacteria group bacterium]|nr:UDP-N-acetylmuramoylalanine--D-glutamate ligase [Patescibacteria group bacterium]